MKRQRSNRRIAPTSDRKKPAGWNLEPGAGFEMRLPRNPPTIEPRIPMATVIRKPILSLPGSRARAMRPTKKPVMIDQSRGRIVTFLLLPDQSGSCRVDRMRVYYESYRFEREQGRYDLLTVRPS